MKTRKFFSSRRSLLTLLVLVMLLAPAAAAIGGCDAAEDVAKDIITKAEDELEKVLEQTMAHTVTVTGFTCPIPVDADTGDAEAGNVFASVNIEIKNDSENDIMLGPGNFSLEDADGATYDASTSYSGPNALTDSSTIAAGKTLEAVLVFEVPADAKPKTLLEEAIAGDISRYQLPEAS